MAWHDKLTDWAWESLQSTLGGSLEHKQRQIRERIKDWNTFDVIADNHDLLRAVRLAWVRAALTLFDAAEKSIGQMSKAAQSEFQSSEISQFLAIVRPKLIVIRNLALDRRIAPSVCSIDRHIQQIILGTGDTPLNQVENSDIQQENSAITQNFAAILAELVQWPIQEIPLLFTQLATRGISNGHHEAKRNFSELVLAAFMEQLTHPEQFPEAGPAFNAEMHRAAQHLLTEILKQIQGIDPKLDEVLSHTRMIPDLQKGMQQCLSGIQAIAQAQDIKSETDSVEAYQTIVAQLDRKEYERVLCYKPNRLETYRAQCIARWSQPRYALDKRFTPLTLLLDQGDEMQGERYQRQAHEFSDLQEVLTRLRQRNERVLVLTGAPGSGKSTLLRRLELDLANAALSSGDPLVPLTLFLSLNEFGYRGHTLPDPMQWITEKWGSITENLPDFPSLLRKPFFLLLDGLNEIPHGGQADYRERLAVWKRFLEKIIRDYPSVWIVFSCRTLDYGSQLTTKEIPRISQVEVVPLSNPQIRSFLQCYAPEQAQSLWNQLESSAQHDLYRSPYYLKLLIAQACQGEIPIGRTQLFTAYILHLLKREVDEHNSRLEVDGLLHPHDRERLLTSMGKIELPNRGQLFTALAQLAFSMQRHRSGDDKSHVRLSYDKALSLLAEASMTDWMQQDALLKTAVDLQILDLPGDDVLFVHQLLQEYFAARHLSVSFNTAATGCVKEGLCQLVKVAWQAQSITPSITALWESLPKSATLPDLPSNGWEETVSLATPLMAQPDEWIHALAEVNLPLAGRCAAQSDVKLSASVRKTLQQQLVARSRDPDADLRARIQAGLALGELGDPRFQCLQGKTDRYLLPPMVAIAGGAYPMGSDEGDEDETPPNHVTLEAFQIGQFPVTNAEFRYFIEAGGYQQENWWQTEAAKRWCRGEGTGDADKNHWRYWRSIFQSDADRLLQVAEEQAWPEQLLRSWQGYCAMPDAEFEAVLDERFPNQQWGEPGFWHDPAFRSPNQPVVGVSWFEAMAYCAWLSAQTGEAYRLLTESEWEAAARGMTGRRYPWGDEFRFDHCNSLESKWRRTTPIGVFPQGDAQAGDDFIADLAGNIWEWTLSAYRRYSDQVTDGRETLHTVDPRVLRGGSWDSSAGGARSACRGRNEPDYRDNYFGFRLALGRNSL